MAGKRKRIVDDDAIPSMTGREKKKQKNTTARAINAQTRLVVDSMKGVPSVIDVEKFAEARAFEIRSMDSGMKSARKAASQRVWQTLPRHMRRRAASHDPRRVPVRLRKKALFELDGVRKKSAGKSKLPKRGTNNQVTRTELLLRRQQDKTWLESHIWHAKRMKMKDLWGYRLAIHPTEKSFRPSYRAAVNGSILHDASYFSLIELKGKEATLKAVLKICCDPMGTGVSAARYTTGGRVCETHIYGANSYPHNLIAPAFILWDPKLEPLTLDQTTVVRKIWIRFHPSAFDQVQIVLQASAAQVLSDLKVVRDLEAIQFDSAEEQLEISDRRSEVNVFEIAGPKSTQVLKGVLNLVKGDQRQIFKKVWETLSGVQTTASIPRGMVLGFKVHDPRLSFPPKNVKAVVPTGDDRPEAFETNPSGELAQSDIWDIQERDKLRVKRYKKAELDARRNKQLVPGTRLQPQAEDDRIPCLLIQRTVGGTSGSSTIHGWTLIVPAGWSMPFLTSLIHTGTRVGGLRERRTQAFESGGTLAFPEDYITTDAFAVHAKSKATEEKHKWARTPPAKRVNFEVVSPGIDVWTPDWERVLGLPPTRQHDAGTTGAVGERELIPTQPMELDTQADGESSVVPSPWLLRGSDLPTILGLLVAASESERLPQILLDKIVAARTRRGMSATQTIELDAQRLWESCLVGVGLRMLGRGSPGDSALIYGMSAEEESRWLKILESNDGRKEAESEDAAAPDPKALIGYVTSGNYSLSRGRGYGVGAVALATVVDCMRRVPKSTASKAEVRTHGCLVKVKDRDGVVCRVARLQFLSV